jgi:tRNA ligase
MPSSSAADSDLIAALHKLAKTAPKLVRSSTYLAPADPRVSIRSWKMNEFKYYDVPSPFPTLARGLFTRWDEDNGGGGVDAQVENATGEGGSKGRYSIVARGYDKFFNIGEVSWTTVCLSSLRPHHSPSLRQFSGKRLKPIPPHHTC